MKPLSIFLLRIYKKTLSPLFSSLFGGGCRFTPTCSEYTIMALERYGFLKGARLGLLRILRCNPWGGSGFDPVPERHI